MKEDGIYAARDRLGRLPLVVGEKDGEYVVATETCSFLNLGYRIAKYLEPGEIIRIGKDGLREQLGGRPAHQICAFLWIYTGYPASVTKVSALSLSAKGPEGPLPGMIP